MGVRNKIQDKIKKKEEEIQEYETKILEANAYIQALRESLKLLPKEEAETISPEKLLRPGSMASKTYELLKKAGKPMHINEILVGIGMTTEKKNRVSLSGTLGLYARKNEIFTRVAPNTFSLINIGKTSAEESTDESTLSGGEEEEDS